MEKLKLFRALLVAVMMLGGVSFVWADALNEYTTIDLSDATTYEVTTYDFKSAASTAGVTLLTQGADYMKVARNLMSVYTTEYGNTFAFQLKTSEDNANYGFCLRYNNASQKGLYSWGRTRDASIVGLKAGYVIEIKGTENCISDKFNTDNFVSDETDAENGNYVYTMKADADFNFSIGSSSSNYDYIYTISIYKGKSPALSISGTSGTSRKFTLSCDDESATIYYSETEKAIGDDGWTEYTGEVTTSSPTIWAYTATSKVSSEVTSFATGAGTEIKLNAPYFSKSAYSTGLYTIYINQDQSSVTPAVGGTPTIKYSIDGGEEQTYSGAFTAAPGSTITAYATYTGYGNSDETTCEPASRPTYSSAVWSQDYTNLVTEDNKAHYIVLDDTPFTVNGTNFYNIAGYIYNEETKAITVDSHVGLNTASGFNLRKNGASSGILQNSKNQYIGLQNLTVGDIIIVTTNGNWIDPNYGVTFLDNISTSSEFYFQIDETEASLTMYNGTYNYVYTISEIAPKWNAPTISEADAGENGWTVSITGDAGATLSYKIGTGEYQTYSAPFDVAASTEVTAKASGGSYGESTETVFTTSAKKVATPTVAYASYNYEQGGYTITPSCATEGVTFQYRIGSTGDFTDCTVPFYAKNGKLYVKAKKTGWTESDVFEGYDLNVAPSTTSPETLIAFQKTNDSGDKNIDHIYKSVTITGGNSGAIAGISGSGAKLKLRTNQSSNTITLNVNSGYKVTGVSITANSNNSADGHTIDMTSVSVDGGSNIMSENKTFPLSNATAATYNTGSIAATSSIVMTFNNGTASNKQILASIVVTYMTPAEVEVADAIADCKTYDTSSAFTTAIDAGSFASAEEVYAFNTSWHITNGVLTDGVRDITGVIRNATIANGNDWGGSNTNSGEQYSGAPDNTYLDQYNGTINTNQTIYGVPAGVYEIKAATRASAGTSGTLYANDGTSDVGKVGQINNEGNTGGDLGNGWSWSTMKFTLTDTKNLLIGFWADASSKKWAGCDDWHMYRVESVSPSITSSTGYATFSSPYAVDFSGEGELTVYKAKVNGAKDAVVLTAIDSKTIPANTGVILAGSAKTYTGTVVGSAEAVSDNDLLASTTNTAAINDYILVEEDSKAVFAPMTGGTLATGKAYLPNSAIISGAKSLKIVFDDETLGISDAMRSNDNGETSDKLIFNLSGQRLATPQKGVNIINGRKVIVK